MSEHCKRIGAVLLDLLCKNGLSVTIPPQDLDSESLAIEKQEQVPIEHVQRESASTAAPSPSKFFRMSAAPMAMST